MHVKVLSVKCEVKLTCVKCVGLDLQSCSTPGLVTTWMGDCKQINHLAM